MALNILVVDDSSVMRTMIIKTLRMSKLPWARSMKRLTGQRSLNGARWELDRPRLGGHQHARDGCEEMLNS